MKHLICLLLSFISLDGLNAQSTASNKDGKVWITTTDPRITLQYAGPNTTIIPVTFVMPDTVNVSPPKQRLSLMFKGWVVRKGGKDTAYLLPNGAPFKWHIDFYTTNTNLKQ